MTVFRTSARQIAGFMDSHGSAFGDPYEPVQWMKTSRPAGRVFHYHPGLTDVLRRAWHGDYLR